MIVDYLHNLSRYMKNDGKLIEEFVSKINEKTSEGRIELSNTIFANVETYQTRNKEDCLIEAHKKYADVQYMLAGSERIDVFDLEKLSAKTVYSESKDITFFEDFENISASVNLSSGIFLLLMPNDAHRPQMASHSKSVVKKIVIKIPIEFLNL